MRTLCIAIVFALGCKGNDKAEQKKTTADEATGETAAIAAGSATEATGGTGTGGGGVGGTGELAAAPKQLEPAPEPKLHERPVERRLYSDRIEASSFLWTDWNKFQENYHPNYILDGDPTTAWVEGADSSGKGEWVRIHVSPVEGATKIRVRVRNGYQKSKGLFGKNARLKQVELVALPSNTKHVADVADAMGWQEIAFEQPAGKLESIELRAVEVVEGTKYTDLCVSDIELYVTGLTVENPAFEKAKLDALLAWKKKRIEAAKLLGGAKAAELPILPGYRVVPGDRVGFAIPKDGNAFAELRGSIAELAKHAGAPGYADAARRATAALESRFAGWVKVQVTARAPIEVPEVDGLREAISEELIFGGPDDALLLPGSRGHGSLVRSAQLGVFDVKGGNPMDETDCKRGKEAFMRGPRKVEDGPVPRELLVIRCVSEETREGEARYMVWQLLEFDAEGNLALTAGPEREVQWFEWQQSTLVGGGRLKSEGDALEKLVAARLAK
jgi:hypothetical protein